jgi:hypothetical protein
MAMRKGQNYIAKFINDLLEWGIMVGVGLDDELKQQ